MKLNIRLAAAALCCALALCGCVGPSGNVEELLTAPRTGADQSAITAVLNDAAIADTVQLKYPRTGSYLSPFVFTDLNGNGQQEAVVFYADEQVSKNVRLAVLEKTDGAWHLVCDTEGLGTDIDAVEISRMYEDGVISLVVGYSSVNMSDKHLAVYNFRDDVLAKLYDQSYSHYAITDFTASGTEDLAIISPETQPGPVELSLITVKSGAIATLSTLTLDTRLQSCAGLYTGKSKGEGAALIIDGETAAGISSDVLEYREGRFVSRSFEVGKDLVDLTARVPEAMKSRDTNGDGAVEVPVVLGSVRTAEGQERWYWVAYYDFACIESYENNFIKPGNSFFGLIESVLPVATPTPAPTEDAAAQPTPTPTPAPTNETVFGIYDAAYDCFVPLPDEWKNQVSLRAMANDDWCIVDKNDPASKLFVMQVVEKGGELADNTPLYGKKEEYTQVGSANGSRLYARVSAGATQHPAAMLANITVMN